jgi:hypothetical protein
VRQILTVDRGARAEQSYSFLLAKPPGYRSPVCWEKEKKVETIGRISHRSHPRWIDKVPDIRYMYHVGTYVDM